MPRDLTTDEDRAVSEYTDALLARRQPSYRRTETLGFVFDGIGLDAEVTWDPAEAWNDYGTVKRGQPTIVSIAVNEGVMHPNLFAEVFGALALEGLRDDITSLEDTEDNDR